MLIRREGQLLRGRLLGEMRRRGRRHDFCVVCPLSSDFTLVGRLLNALLILDVLTGRDLMDKFVTSRTLPSSCLTSCFLKRILLVLMLNSRFAFTSGGRGLKGGGEKRSDGTHLARIARSTLVIGTRHFTLVIRTNLMNIRVRRRRRRGGESRRGFSKGKKAESPG